MKKLVTVLLSLMLLATSAACGTTQQATNPSSQDQPSASSAEVVPEAAAPAEFEPAEISILLGGDNTPPPDNAVLLEVQKRTGVHMNATYVPMGDLSAKLSTLIAAKNIPDIIKVMNNVSEAQQFVDNGFVIDVAPYLDEFGPNILAETKDILNNSPLNKDGQVYALISSFLPYPSSLCIRTDWLKNVGLEMPTDLDSLYNVLKAFTENDPNQNGAKDTYGLGANIAGGWRNFAAIFGAHGIGAGTSLSAPVQLDDGTITTFMKHPRWIEAVKYINKLYQEGLMEPDFATIPQMSAFEKLWNGTTGAFDFQAAGTTNNWMPGRYTENPVPTFDFAIIEGPGGRGGSEAQYPEYKNSIMISSTCERPDAAVKLLDFFISQEGDELLRLGIEGVHYDWVDKAAGTFKMIAPYDDGATHRNEGAYVYWEFFRPKDHIEMRTFNEQTREGLALAYENIVEYPNIMLPFEADTTYRNTLSDIEKEAFCQLVVTKGDIDQEYAGFVARWENEGGLEWEKGATETYKLQNG